MFHQEASVKMIKFISLKLFIHNYSFVCLCTYTHLKTININYECQKLQEKFKFNILSTYIRNFLAISQIFQSKTTFTWIYGHLYNDFAWLISCNFCTYNSNVQRVLDFNIRLQNSFSIGGIKLYHLY